VRINLTEEPKSFWRKYLLQPVRISKEHYSYIKKNDIYTELKCSNEEVFNEELDDNAPNIAYVAEAGDEEYRPFGIRPEERALQLKIEQEELKKSLWWPLLFTIVYFLLFFGLIDNDFLQGFELLLLIFATIPFFFKLFNYLSVRHAKPEISYEELENSRLNEWLSYSSLKLNYVLPFLLVFMFVLQLGYGMETTILEFGLVKPLDFDNSAYRLITAAFVHGSLMHVFFNASVLYSFGDQFLKFANFWRLLGVFLICAIIGSFFSILMYPETTSVGASGGVLGVFGFIMSLALRNRDIFPKSFLRALIIYLVAIALLGLGAIRVIDNGAHLGGLLGGMALGLLYTKKQLLERIDKQHQVNIEKYERHKRDALAEQSTT
jgi:membrane associated rhomboid family serine protease